jgi:hypothetical protein
VPYRTLERPLSDTYEAGQFAALRDEGAADDFIRDRDIKFGGAVDAGYVLTFFLGGSTLQGHMDILSDFAVWTLNRSFVGRDSGNALQRRNQLLTGFGFGHEPMSPRLRSRFETRTLVDCQEHYLGRGRETPDFLGGCNAIQDGHVYIHEHNFWLQLHYFFNGFFAVLSVSTNLKGVPIQQFTQRCSRCVVVIHDKDSGHIL